ncbi:MAG TPA: Gfo/Idh/MocA family oxidoreductase [Pirellulales bacterium]|jgi:predicted dehydrogenase|nr:Gfo/Idh/MocA family oxidoreductase [Pirellulales bacterium]
MPYGFGIIGCGMIARFHAKAIADVPDAKLVACFDSYAPAVEKFSAEAGCRGYTKLEEMLADPAVQVVTIGTPSGAHLEPAVAAANAGKHVIVEKPLEIMLSRCDAIISACEKNKVKLSAVFPSRFHESSRQMKWAVDEQRFGKLTLGDAYVKWFRNQQYYDSGAWRGTWQLDGGGALMNQAVHSVDLLTWLMGPVAEVTAHTALLAHERIAVEDTCVATLRFSNGALGVIEASTAAYPGYLKRIEIHGDQGTAVMEEEDIKTWDFAQPHPRDEAVRQRMAQARSTGGGASDPSAIGHHGHALQFADVIQAIKNNTTPAVDGNEGRRSVEIILAIYKSAEARQAVQLPLKDDPALAARQRDKTS